MNIPIHELPFGGNSSMFKSIAMTLEEFAKAHHFYSGKQTSSPAFQIGTIKIKKT